MTKYQSFDNKTDSSKLHPLKAVSEERSSKEIVLKTTPRRWAVLSLSTFYLIAIGYNRACFGVVENVYTHYFRVSIGEVDWLTLSMSGISVIAALVLLCLLPIKTFGFRWLCLLTSFCVVASYAFHFVSAFSRDFFLFSLIGQLFMGFVNTTGITLIPVVAALWFSAQEVATAVGVMLGGLAIGNLFGFNFPAHFLEYQAGMTEDIWIKRVKQHLIFIFSVWLTLSVISFVATFFIVKEQPDLPPSRSEAVKRNMVADEQFSAQSLFFRVTYYLKMVINDRTFLALVLCFGMVETCYMLEVLMIADILRYTRSEVHLSTDSNILAAHYLSAYASGALLGGIVSGVVLDKTKRFKAVAIISGVFMVLFSLGFLLAVNFNNVPSSFGTNCAYGFFNGACYTCLYEIIVQHMYPCSEIALGSWIAFFVNTSALTVPLIGRFIYNSIAEIGVLVFQASVLCIATVVIVFLKPRYKRYAVNKEETDSTPLVESSK